MIWTACSQCQGNGAECEEALHPNKETGFILPGKSHEAIRQNVASLIKEKPGKLSHQRNVEAMDRTELARP